jgi:hypothetical protein
VPLAIAPLPVTVAVPLAGATDAERDLRTILHMLAVTGIAVYVLRTPIVFNSLDRLWESLVSPRSARRTSSPLVPGGPGSVIRLAETTLALVGVIWVSWGVLVLSYGARLRQLMLVVAWISIAATVAYFGGVIANLEPTPRGYRGRGDMKVLLMTALNPHLPELVHGLIMWCLLTRPRVKDLFTAGSETGEGT